MIQNNLIFISIASYRDPQLVPTLMDCLKKARHPELLRFGICWQRAAEDPMLPMLEDPRFRVLDVDWRASKGACWARAEIMNLWQGEDWFFQVDSHCRFAEGWDATLVRMMAETGSAKPILSTYATPFTPGEHEVLSGEALLMCFQAFTADGIPQLKPGPIPLTMKLSGPVPPIRARFLAAGFLFAPGRFVEEVPYDPELYFMGEEASMTVRAFTHGFDLFHPGETVVWHDYVRADAKKHWGDHTDAEVVTSHWSDLDERSKRKVQRLLLGEHDGAFGLGTVRTLAEYEAYAGLSFRLRKAQQYTVRGGLPPNPEAAADWADGVYPWIARVLVKRQQLPAGALDDPGLWTLLIQDEEGYEICRKDLSPEELSPLHGDQNDMALICEFDSETIPARWILLPLSKSKGWLQRVAGRLGEGDFAILSGEVEQL